jgi:hypothetical protein
MNLPEHSIGERRDIFPIPLMWSSVHPDWVSPSPITSSVFNPNRFRSTLCLSESNWEPADHPWGCPFNNAAAMAISWSFSQELSLLPVTMLPATAVERTFAASQPFNHVCWLTLALSSYFSSLGIKLRVFCRVNLLISLMDNVARVGKIFSKRLAVRRGARGLKKRKERRKVKKRGPLSVFSRRHATTSSRHTTLPRSFKWTVPIAFFNDRNRL